MDLIPSLPKDIALECLIRVSYEQFSVLASICKSWKQEIELPEFRHQRKLTNHTQKLIVMSQASKQKLSPSSSSIVIKRQPTPVYGITVFEPGTGHWFELPQVPGFFNGLPMFCQVAAVGLNIVVIGGLDAVTWEVTNYVYVFSFVTAKWRRGADMPGVRRSMFGCTSDGDRMVYVAGGHDGDKNALRSAMAYDVEGDEWVVLPDMARERDECKTVFRNGKLHVIGGYSTDKQGRFEKDAEVFDVATWEWSDVEEGFLESAMCPRTCTVGDDKDYYVCREGEVAVRRGDTWQGVTKLPAEVSNVAYVTNCCQGKLMVIGSERFGEPHTSYVLDLKSYTWTKMEMPELFSGHVQSGCYMEI